MFAITIMKKERSKPQVKNIPATSSTKWRVVVVVMMGVRIPLTLYPNPILSSDGGGGSFSDGHVTRPLFLQLQ